MPWDALSSSSPLTPTLCSALCSEPHCSIEAPACLLPSPQLTSSALQHSWSWNNPLWHHNQHSWTPVSLETAHSFPFLFSLSQLESTTGLSSGSKTPLSLGVGRKVGMRWFGILIWDPNRLHSGKERCCQVSENSKYPLPGGNLLNLRINAEVSKGHQKHEFCHLRAVALGTHFCSWICYWTVRNHGSVTPPHLGHFLGCTPLMEQLCLKTWTLINRWLAKPHLKMQQ